VYTYEELMNISANGLEWRYPPVVDWLPDTVQVTICRNFLRQCERTRTPRRGSYWLKHVVERWVDTYVSNGALIQAALDEGLVVVPHGYGLPNAGIGVGVRSVRRVARLDKEISPSSVSSAIQGKLGR